MLKKPNSMEECIYFTNRTIGNGKVVAWVFRKDCPKCKKAKMGKPVIKGKVATRAKEYVCPNCNYKEEKKQHEGSLIVNIEYTCPNCSFKGEKEIPFKRKKIEGVETLRFQCDKCNSNIDITKKMKEIKKKEG